MTFLKTRLLFFICLFILVGFQFSCTTPTTDNNTSIFQDVDNAVIIDLNNLACTVANNHDAFNALKGIRALTLMHLSLHDIFNSLEENYQPYSYYYHEEDIYPEVAAAISAKVILAKSFPQQVTMINDACNYWVNQVEMSDKKKRSMMFGLTVAKHYEEVSHQDGHDALTLYTPKSELGSYQYTSRTEITRPYDLDVVKPFVLDSMNQFRVAIPPAMTSERYTQDYQEVKDIGKRNSSVRSADATSSAHFWTETGALSWNSIGRTLASKRDLSLTETNRMFALINMTLYDLQIASFESKYQYNTWRPETAIRMADSDINPNTAAESNWESEINSPPWPAYPSRQAAVGAMATEILNHVYQNEDLEFDHRSTTALENSKTQSYFSLDQALTDCAEAQITSGTNFRFSVDAGTKQGRALAKYIYMNELYPLK